MPSGSFAQHPKDLLVGGHPLIHEMQPVLDKYCVGCHNGQPNEAGRNLPDMQDNNAAGFSAGYNILQAHVRRPGPEGDYHMYPPAEYDADTSPLIQMLKKGLAYKKESPVNWCPKCETVLANEQVKDGRCWRCDWNE